MVECANDCKPPQTIANNRKPSLNFLSPMKIIRFLDNLDFIRHGVQKDDGTTVLLEGDIFGEYRPGKEPAQIKKLLAPIAPVSIACIGLNYRHHAAESGSPIPQHPVLFHKAV